MLEMRKHYRRWNILSAMWWSPNMEALKEKIYTFWDDANAQQAGIALNKQIRDVKNAMDTTYELLTFYKTAVEKLEGANIQVSDILGDIFGLLG